MRSLRLIILVIALLPQLVVAFTLDDKLADADQESRAVALFNEIKCMVCSGQSIHDSNAELAREMRIVIRKEIEQGKSDQEVRDFMQQRYGDEILLSPPLQLSTAILWFFPLILLVLGGFTLRKHVQSKHK